MRIQLVSIGRKSYARKRCCGNAGRVGRRGNAHHSIIEWMLYEEGRISLRYIGYALPVFALVTRDVEVAPNDVVVCDVLARKNVVS